MEAVNVCMMDSLFSESVVLDVTDAKAVNLIAETKDGWQHVLPLKGLYLAITEKILGDEKVAGKNVTFLMTKHYSHVPLSSIRLEIFSETGRLVLPLDEKKARRLVGSLLLTFSERGWETREESELAYLYGTNLEFLTKANQNKVIAERAWIIKSKHNKSCYKNLQYPTVEKCSQLF